MNRTGKRRVGQIVIYSAALIPISLIPSLVGFSGALYLCGALILGLAYLHFSVSVAKVKSTLQARRLLQASVVYLPLVYVLLLVDKIAL